ncbi:MAG TPA: NAD-dependent epimerase/dehydratase family protein [Candidatus Saccharimonadales bacterium]|nr:NAD-dependent epimerase/dehydratase family protein [Candidatus Saccharimonadales bacterium]
MQTKNILVTGVNGFVGHHLAKELTNHKIGVIGVGSQPQPAAALQPFLLDYVQCDLTDEAAVDKLPLSKATAIIHLAAMASKALSFTKPKESINSNSNMVINLFEAALRQDAHPRFVQVSSGAIYRSDQPMPLTEASELGADSPYAIGKILCEQLCEYYGKRGFEYVILRPFNHTGPGQGLGYLIPDLTSNALKAGKGGELLTGNLSSKRDYSDVRDVVRAYTMIATAEKIPHSIYNVCSGESHSGEDILRLITEALYDNETALTSKVDESKLRPFEPSDIVGDHSLLSEDFGWQPQISLEQTITDYAAWFEKEAH